MNPRWAGFRNDIWTWVVIGIGLMSGIAATLREWFSVFHPSAADSSRLFNACAITCLFIAAVIVFFRQRSAITSLEDAQKRDRNNKAEAQRLHVVFGDFMAQGEGLARELRQGLPRHQGVEQYNLWVQKRGEWVQRVSDALRDIGLPDEASAFRHAVEGDPDITQLLGPNQSVYWRRFYNGQLDNCRQKLADIVARRLDFHL